MAQKKYFIKIILFAIFILNIGWSQTITINLSLQMDRLIPQEQDILMPLEQQIEDYVNNYNWTEEYEEIIIECTANLIIETVTNRGADKIYRSQFLISSPSGENYYDKSCEFVYQQGQSMNHSRASFDPLVGLVDYYIYMVLGGEMDTWLLRGGSKYYDRVQNIANEGSISNYSTGWNDRLEQVQLITGSEHIPLREAKFHYYDCLFQIEAKRNQTRARELSQLVLQKLETVHNRRPNSPALKRFFDSHFKEMCSLFVFAEGNAFKDRLANMDPRHSDTYRSCGEGNQP